MPSSPAWPRLQMRRKIMPSITGIVPGGEILPRPGCRRHVLPMGSGTTKRPRLPNLASSPLFRREHHDHLTAFHGRFGFDLGDAPGLGFHPLEQPESQILMRHLAAAEAQSDFHLVALLEKPADGFHLDAVIMVVDSRTQLDLLDLDNLLLFPGFRRFFLLQEAEFAIIEDLADRGIGRGNDFDKIKSRFIGRLLGLNNLHDTTVLAFGIDQLNFASVDFTVYTRPVLLRNGGGL